MHPSRKSQLPVETFGLAGMVVRTRAAARKSSGGDGGEVKTPQATQPEKKSATPKKKAGIFKTFIYGLVCVFVVAVVVLYGWRYVHTSTIVTNQSSSTVIVAHAVRQLHIGVASFFTGVQSISLDGEMLTVKPGESVTIEHGSLLPLRQRCVIMARDDRKGREDLHLASNGGEISPAKSSLVVRDAEVVLQFYVVDDLGDMAFNAMAPLGEEQPVRLGLLDVAQYTGYDVVLGLVKDKVELYTSLARERVSKLWKSQPLSHKESRVRLGMDRPGEAEEAFIAARSPHASKALRNFLGIDDGTQLKLKNITIGFAGSGGGYRAMVAYLGFLRGAEKMGLLDAAHYVSGVSGSTWALAQIYSMAAQSKSHSVRVKDVAQKVSERVQNDMSKPIPLESWDDAGWMIDRFVERHLAGNGLSLVDFYGTHISHYLLQDGGNEAERLQLSSQVDAVKDGQMPLPIYTSVFREGKKFQWLELTPFEVGMTNLGAFIPTWGFGRKYKNGESLAPTKSGIFANEPSLGLLCGVFGSAFCATIELMFGEIEALLPEDIAIKVKEILNDSLQIGDKHPIPPASVPNFLYQVGDARFDKTSVTNEERLYIMDAGINFNIPVPPLLSRARNVDVMIIMDASTYGGRQQLCGSELALAQKYAEAEGRPFPAIDFEGVSDRVVSVFPGKPGSDEPTVIYFPLIRQHEGEDEFDPQQDAASGGFTSTYNFKYTTEEFNLLSEHMEKAIVGAQKELQKALLDRAAK